LRFIFALLLLIAALGTSPNPWGNVKDLGPYSQALAIVGLVQMFEGFIAWAKANERTRTTPASS